MLKYLSLVLLAVQTTLVIMMVRYVRTQKGDMFVASTAVIICEAFKMLASLAIILYQERSIHKLVQHLMKHIIDQPVDCIRMSIPAIIYVFQNNLFYVAVSNLDAATCQVTYQLKIFTTAVCSVIMLKTKISRLQWISLCILFVGVSVVLLPSTESTKGETLDVDKNRVVGIICVVISCCLSGFSGVYFEKILKGTKGSIWLRNVQLGMFGIAIGFITMGIRDGIKVIEKGFFHGYYSAVWFVIFLQSFGGLCTAVVVKYANNILKGFSTSGAIVLSCIISVYLFDFKLTIEFTFGALLVVLSVFMYSKFPMN
ncbi:UDP-galactose translocator-like [Mytilus californianus]|uniref:UDP-galactose translocator-like n=1 Tax=Mytilus californianus TaxID=6549 RepID=UPI002246A6E3|nr:UDP-galactose translocator-like [Mytilus californianus]